MAIVPQDLRDLPSGEFSSLTDPQIQPFIDRAYRRLSVELWGNGDLRDDGALCLSAHLLASAVSGSAGAAGPVQTERADGLSRTYATPSGSAAAGDFNSTGYGRCFAQLRAELLPSPLLI